MGKSYRDMHKINELAADLIKELKKFDDYLQGEVSYMGRDMIGAEVRSEMERWGEDDPSAVDVPDKVIQSINDEIDDWIKTQHPEFDTLREVLPLLRKLTATDPYEADTA